MSSPYARVRIDSVVGRKGIAVTENEDCPTLRIGTKMVSKLKRNRKKKRIRINGRAPMSTKAEAFTAWKWCLKARKKGKKLGEQP